MFCMFVYMCTQMQDHMETKKGTSDSLGLEFQSATSQSVWMLRLDNNPSTS